VSFPPTRLSVVARVRDGNEDTRRVAHADLVEAYWKPVYKYLRLKWHMDPEGAADATQDFFVSVLERRLVARYDPGKARFRTYLRTCLDGFAANQLKAERRLKRGGDARHVPLDFTTAEGELVRIEPAVPAEVDELFYREWVRALFDRAVADLRIDAEARGRGVMFEVFARYDLADAAARPSYEQIARALGITAHMVTNHLAAMRRDFRRIVLDRLREMTGSEAEWESEARRLLGGGW
jgi:RNA polymerase sigma factor (sigma-70 family)